jgi:peptidoglycan/xylan/chitin deacetylase (PgdA/CDA1 family)
MNQSHRKTSLPVPADFSMPAALPHARSFVESPYQMISGKLSRFLARNVPIKKLTMRNARPLVSFTFDDAAASACSTGALLLEQYQVRGTFYISGGKCGTASPTGRLATTGQVKALYASGHEIGCHTFSHTPVGRIGRDALASELDRNRSFLQGILGNIALRNFAYPYGDISFGTKRYLGEHFDSCRSHTPGVNAGVADLGILKSCALEKASIDRQGILEIITEAVRRNGWLLFSSHDVDDEPSRFGVQPELLAFALRSAREAGCQLVAVSQALRILSGAAPDEQAS